MIKCRRTDIKYIFDTNLSLKYMFKIENIEIANSKQIENGNNTISGLPHSNKNVTPTKKMMLKNNIEYIILFPLNTIFIVTYITFKVSAIIFFEVNSDSYNSLLFCPNCSKVSILLYNSRNLSLRS